MAYACDIGNGQRLLVQNDGDNTQVAVSSGDSGQKQNQSTGFTTGEWSKPPELFRTHENLILRVEGKNGVHFIGIHGNQIESMRSEPKLEHAEKLTLKESNENIGRMKPMEPMKPMKPMEPMKPMN
jgi:hypothetical protein